MSSETHTLEQALSKMGQLTNLRFLQESKVEATESKKWSPAHGVPEEFALILNKALLTIKTLYANS